MSEEERGEKTIMKTKEIITNEVDVWQGKHSWVLSKKIGDSYLFHDITHRESSIFHFYITYAPNGTTMLSGDLGVLCWKRHEGYKDVSFPNLKTGIGYFEEKCRLADTNKDSIYEFDFEYAFTQAKEAYSYWQEEGDEEEYLKMLEELDEISLEYSEEQEKEFYRVLGKYDSDWWDMEWKKYKQHFENQWKMLQVAGEAILEYERSVVRNEG